MIINHSVISRLFISIYENKVVCAQTNLVDFILSMKQIEPSIKSREYYTKHFKENDFYYFQNKVTGKQYIFQKIENEKIK